ncbi:SRPBCC family protein [Bacillus sp. CGMCC 1.16541]|uniref:SRPBCC family protein n=1 Tax=Bacillus sp. CGMCC 1.16541 TaxID=2185143 RepID=UPI000D72AFB4|nr:SRPBCC family protein [Bacillus sp. CGMCC 1.16541]
MKYTVEVVINAPQEEVFAAINEDEQIKQWNSLFVENRYESEEDRHTYKPGTKYTSVTKIGKKEYAFEGTLLEYDAPYKTTAQSNTKEGVNKITYICESLAANRTRVVMHLEVEPSNFYYKIMIKLFGWLTKGLYMEQFESLKEYLESRD